MGYLALITVSLMAAPAMARVTIAEELNYLIETIGPIAAADGYEFDADSLAFYNGDDWNRYLDEGQLQIITFRVRREGRETTRRVNFAVQPLLRSSNCPRPNVTTKVIRSVLNETPQCLSLHTMGYLGFKTRASIGQMPEHSLWRSLLD